MSCQCESYYNYICSECKDQVERDKVDRERKESERVLDGQRLDVELIFREELANKPGVVSPAQFRKLVKSKVGIDIECGLYPSGVMWYSLPAPKIDIGLSVSKV